jgi:hypothetical protein
LASPVKNSQATFKIVMNNELTCAHHAPSHHLAPYSLLTPLQLRADVLSFKNRITREEDEERVDSIVLATKLSNVGSVASDHWIINALPLYVHYILSCVLCCVGSRKRRTKSTPMEKYLHTYIHAHTHTHTHTHTHIHIHTQV